MDCVIEICCGASLLEPISQCCAKVRQIFCTFRMVVRCFSGFCVKCYGLVQISDSSCCSEPDLQRRPKA